MTVISQVAESSIVTICRVSQDRSFPPQTGLRPGLKPMPSGCRRCTTRALEIAKSVPPSQLDHKREELMIKPPPKMLIACAINEAFARRGKTFEHKAIPQHYFEMDKMAKLQMA